MTKTARQRRSTIAIPVHCSPALADPVSYKKLKNHRKLQSVLMGKQSHLTTTLPTHYPNLSSNMEEYN
jgi:hypothetical protein